MEIKYLQQVVNNPILDGFKNRGLNVAQIEQLEEEFNNSREFVKPFREYIFLAGDFNNFGFDDLGEGLSELQKICKEELETTKQTVERPFFTFSVYDSQYSVIFLDEDKPDPDIYIIDPFAPSEGEELIRQSSWVFSKLVNESIRRVKNNIPF